MSVSVQNVFFLYTPVTCHSEPTCRVSYAVDYENQSCLRPYHLSWRGDTGCSGFIEPEQAVCLMEVMLTEGLLACTGIEIAFSAMVRYFLLQTL